MHIRGLCDVVSGNYCPVGSAVMIQCSAGTWGSTTGLGNAMCSGQCTAGMGMILVVVWCIIRYIYLRHCYRFANFFINCIPRRFPQVIIARLAALPRPQSYALLGTRIYFDKYTMLWCFNCLFFMFFGLLICRSYCQNGAGIPTTCNAGIFFMKNI